MDRLRVTIGVICAMLLGGCSSAGNNDAVRVLNKADVRGPMTEDQIRTVLAGKTFQYTRPEGNGIITYNADGTTAFEADGTGPGTGSWRVDDGKLCEAVNPSDTNPDGRGEICEPFTNTGDAYYAGKARFVSM